MADIVYRQAGEEDLEQTFEVVLEADRDLNQKHGRSRSLERSVPRERALAFRRNALRHDPERFWVAESGGQLVASGIATQREHVWYLAALHVIPRFQAQGVGGELLRRCLASGLQGTILTVLTEAINPISNALYSKRGMFPQTPLISLEGPTEGWSDGGELSLKPFPSGGVDPEPLSAIDRAVLGYRRPQDHALWAGIPNLHGFVVERAGSPAGYLYVSDAGVLGPIALLRAEDLAPALNLGVRLARDLGAPSSRVRLPGIGREAMARLLERGFQFGETIGLFLSSEPFGQLDRYVPSGADAIF
jgi:GNAT superfamily N-acetyltransferase